MSSITLGFMAKQDWRTSTWFGDENKTVWFIEHEETRQWLKEKSILDYGKNEFKYTNEPHKAMSFPSELSALTFSIKNKVFNEHIITEHEFTGYLR
jgi:hypothetical protein